MSITFHVVVEEDEAGWFVVECPALPSCVSQGRTHEGAIDNIKDAISGWLAAKDEQAIVEYQQKDVLAVTV